MADEKDLTPIDSPQPPSGGRAWLRPALIGLGCAVALAAFYFGGGALIEALRGPVKPEQPKAATSVPHGAPEGLAELTSDTIGAEEEGIALPSDTLALPLQEMTSAPVDTFQAEDIPGMSDAEMRTLLNTVVTGEEAQMDTSLTLEEAITAPLRPEPQQFLRGMSGGRADTSQSPAGVASKDTITSSLLGSTGAGPGQAVFDSLAAQLALREQELARITEENSRLADRMKRLGGGLDSAQTAQLKRLAKIIETMKPAAAAAMLASQTPGEVTEILFRVKPRTAAQIMENLPPTLATDIAARVVRR